MSQTIFIAPSLLADAEALFSPAAPHPFPGRPRNPLYLPNTQRYILRHDTYYIIDPYVVALLWSFLEKLRDLIIAGSHAYIEGISQGPHPEHVNMTTLRQVSRRIGFPPIFQLFQYLHEHNILEEQLTIHDAKHYWSTYCTVACDTVTWIRRSISAIHTLGERTTFSWEIPSTSEVPLHYTAYQANEDINDSDNREILSTHTAMILHPILSSNAHNEVVPYSPQDALFTPTPPKEARPINTCRALIPHPIYGREAQNQVVLYRPSVPLAFNGRTRRLDQTTPYNSPTVVTTELGSDDEKTASLHTTDDSKDGFDHDEHSVTATQEPL